VSSNHRAPSEQPTSEVNSGKDRRVWPRVSASALRNVRVQLSAGDEVELKDLSRSGARFQTETRLRPGLSVAIRFTTSDGVISVKARVVRSRLVRMDRGGMGYEVGVAFSDLIREVVEEMGQQSDAAPSPEPPTGEASAAPDNEESSDDAAPIVMISATVQQTSGELRELFNGNDW
jgi:hypothetical protein